MGRADGFNTSATACLTRSTIALPWALLSTGELDTAGRQAAAADPEATRDHTGTAT